MHQLRLKGAAAHALFHVMQQVDNLLQELDFLDLHQISVRCVNQCFTHGLNAKCQHTELEQAIHTILGQLPSHVAELPELLPWQSRYRDGLTMELAGKLHQALGLVTAYLILPETLSRPNFDYVHTAEGVIGHDPDVTHWLELACAWQPGEGPWG